MINRFILSFLKFIDYLCAVIYLIVIGSPSIICHLLNTHLLNWTQKINMERFKLDYIFHEHKIFVYCIHYYILSTQNRAWPISDIPFILVDEFKK